MRLYLDKIESPTSTDVTRVLFIVGALRSGSTLLDRVIGAHEGFCSIGEAHTIWERSFRENQLCGCGEHFYQCAFWTDVSRRAFGVVPAEFDSTNAIHLKDSVGRIRHSPWLFFPFHPKRNEADLSAYGDLIRRLYGAIKAESGARVIVDSSKNPTHALALSRLPGIEVDLVHLVRDPRAVAFSQQREQKQTQSHQGTDNAPIERVSTSASRWLITNSLAGRLSTSAMSYCRLQYEDFIANPDAVLSKILEPYEWIEGHTKVSDMEILLEPAHTVAGNRMRFKLGTLKLQLDDEWREAMPRRDRQTVEALTWPLLRRYGYNFGTTKE
jgi:Sulfotransferase family